MDAKRVVFALLVSYFGEMVFFATAGDTSRTVSFVGNVEYRLV